MNPAESPFHYHRRRPIGEGPTIRDRVRDDLANHRQTTTRETAERLELTISQVASALTKLRTRGEVAGEKVGCVYVSVGVDTLNPSAASPVIEVPAPLPPTPKQERQRLSLVAQRRAMGEWHLGELYGLLKARYPKKVTLTDVCVSLRWGRIRARHYMRLAVDAGRAERTTPLKVAGLWRWVPRK